MFSLVLKPTFAVANAVRKELYILWRVINYDIWDTVLPATVIFLSSWFFYHPPWSHFPATFATAFTYGLLYIYTFCLSNQVLGDIEEDRANKPYRPLAAGIVTLQELRWRLYVFNLLYLLYGYYLGIFWLTLSWIVVSHWVNAYGCKHWFSKNLIFITLGTFILFDAQWYIAVPQGQSMSQVQLYFLWMSLWAGFGVQLQDLRDTEGDRVSRRKTLPVILGSRNVRILMVINCILILPLLFLCAMCALRPLASIFSNRTGLGIFIVQILWHWLVAYRVWVYRIPRQDHYTYLFYVVLFCAAIPMICFMS